MVFDKIRLLQEKLRDWQEITYSLNMVSVHRSIINRASTVWNVCKYGVFFGLYRDTFHAASML